MTTLDPIAAVLDELTIESAKELGKGYVVYAKGMARVIDAVRAALPAQPVAVTLLDLDYLIDDVMADAYVAGAEGRANETAASRSSKALHDAIAKALAAPSQQEDVTEEMVESAAKAMADGQLWEGAYESMDRSAWAGSSEEKKIWQRHARLALEAALVDRDRVKPNAGEERTT